jgi:type IV pilus assembly protein PilB
VAITDAELLTIEDMPRVSELLRTKSGVQDLRAVQLTHGQGCASCDHTGYQSRIGIFEVLAIDDEIQELIIKRSTSDALTAAAVAAGMTTMLDDGITKVLNGTTTLEEILRATRE